ncbi:MAG: peptidylprolyl isomerase [Actinomycetota bacterium]
MRPIMKTLLLAAATAVLAASCSSGSVVATVDDATIEHHSVIALRTSFQDTADYDAEAYRGDLTNLIYLEAQKNAAERDFGLTGLDDPEAISAKVANPSEEEAPVFEGVRSNPDRTEATVEAVAEQFIVRDAVAGELIGDVADLTDIYTNQPEMIVEVCARHILTATPEEAADAKARIEAGEDFAAVADEISLDTFSPGGELPCPQAAGDYVPDFSTTAASAPLGEITDPVPSEFGWHIIVVDERFGPESLDEFLADPLANLHPGIVGDLWVEWVDAAIKSADISVRSQIGTWAPSSHGILPPPAG